MRQSVQWGLGVLLFLVLLTGCDSGNEGESDRELMVGTWALVEARDSQGDRTDEVRALGELEVTFKANETYRLVFDPADGSADVVLENDYVLEETTNALTLRAVFLGNPVALPLTYDFEGEDQLVLQANSGAVALVNGLLETSFEGDAQLTLERE